MASPAVRQLLLSGRTAQFTPLSLPGLVAWYDPSDLSTLFQDAARTTAAAADGDPVGGVLDKSGKGWHQSQSTSSQRLTLKLNVQGGRSALLSDGVDDSLASGSFTLKAQPLTVAAVVRAVSGSSRYIGGLTTAFRAGWTGGQVADNYAGVTLNGGSWPVNTWKVVVSLFNGASSTIRLNGVQGAGGDVGSGGMDGITVGIANGQFWKDHIAEVVICNANLALGDVQKLESYLNGRWGIY